MSKFLYEFENLLECFCETRNHLITGDFNMHVDNSESSYVKSFHNLISQYGYCQHVNSATHSGGHILYLILSRKDDKWVNSVSVHDCDISDHSLVLCGFSLSHDRMYPTVTLSSDDGVDWILENLGQIC